MRSVFDGTRRRATPSARDLAAFPLFAEMPSDRLEPLAAFTGRRHFVRAECLFAPGAPAGELYLLEQGKVRLSLPTSRGALRTFAIRSPGELFGDLFFHSRARHTRADALTAGQSLVIPRERVEALLAAEPRFAHAFAAALSQRIADTYRQAFRLSLSRSAERIGRLLLDLARAHGTRVDGMVHLSFLLTHEDLASMIGSSRESVTIALRALLDAGVIAYDPEHRLRIDSERLGAMR